MPRNIYTDKVRVSGDVTMTAGRGAGQMCWYRFISSRLAGKTVLDVGSGTGEGAEVFANIAHEVTKQDIDPQLNSLGVVTRCIEDFESKSFDFVTAIDVIEHVERDQEFLYQVCRVATEACFITTPLHSFRRKFWPFHVREYGFREFHDLVLPFGDCTFYVGDSGGRSIYMVSNAEWFFFVERMINNEVTNFATRALQKCISHKYRFNSHQAVIINVR